MPQSLVPDGEAPQPARQRGYPANAILPHAAGVVEHSGMA